MTLKYRQGSGVTTRGEVRQLPQGAKRQGALWADVLFASAEFLKTEGRSPPAEVYC